MSHCQICSLPTCLFRVSEFFCCWFEKGFCCLAGLCNWITDYLFVLHLLGSKLFLLCYVNSSPSNLFVLMSNKHTAVTWLVKTQTLLFQTLAIQCYDRLKTFRGHCNEITLALINFPWVSEEGEGSGLEKWNVQHYAVSLSRKCCWMTS